MRIVLLGPPGAGKGSLAGLIKDMMGIVHISTGDMLREEMKKGTKLGLKIKGLVEKGALVPDEIVTELVEQKITRDPQLAKGYMFDGFPRTTQQAQELDRILVKVGKPLDFALYMEASLQMILTRLTGRRLCRQCGALFHLKNKPPQKVNVCDLCGGELYQRSDDNEQTIRKRMQVYETNTKLIIDYYAAQGKLRRVDGDKETIDVRDDLVTMLHEDKSYQNQRPSGS
ncbi:MAG: adenylate kinase [Candidatus Omnitrophica bacterium]|nr:adenylate kinase [Candidatus Omnitrophota bacterium]